MGKQSRRQRKHLRQKSDRAESHGLPVGQIPVKKPRPQHMAAAPIADEQVGSETLPESRGWSSWPPAVKVALGGILILIAIGLYRRYTEGGATGIARPNTVPEHAAANSASAAEPSSQPNHR